MENILKIRFDEKINHEAFALAMIRSVMKKVIIMPFAAEICAVWDSMKPRMVR